MDAAIIPAVVVAVPHLELVTVRVFVAAASAAYVFYDLVTEGTVLFHFAVYLDVAAALNLIGVTGCQINVEVVPLDFPFLQEVLT